MEPFIHLAEYSFMVCKVCQFACVADEVATHLRKSHSHLTPKERTTITTTIKAIPDIIYSQAILRRDFAYPAATIKPILFITPPKTDGIRCDICQFITRTIRGIQKHCRQNHRWRNDWQKGGNVVKKARQERLIPWTTGVCYQQFFPSHTASGWFKVGQGMVPAVGGGVVPAVEGSIVPAVETDKQRLLHIHQTQANRFAKTQKVIEAADEKTEPSLWLRRVGWVEHLKGLDKKALQLLIRPIGEDELPLQLIWESLDRVMDRARNATAAGQIGLAVLFEINRKESAVKPHKPFDSIVEDKTWKKYKDMFRRLLCFITQMENHKELDLPYNLTAKQSDLFDRLETEAKC
jgi:hypothetical protein